MVARVDAVIAGPTSVVASSAALKRGRPALYVAIDVLKHDNAVVNNAAYGYGQTAQGHKVQCKALPTHQQHGREDA